MLPRFSLPSINVSPSSSRNTYNSDDKYPYPPGYTTEPKPAPRAGGSQGGNAALWDVAFKVQVTVKNTGDRPGRAVAQLYVELPADSAPGTPKYQLRQFEKTDMLQPGKSETLTMEITRKDVSVWDVEVQDWRVPGNGKADGVKIWVGESVGDLRVMCQVGGGQACQTL